MAAALLLLLAFARTGEAQPWHPLPNAHGADRYDYALGDALVPGHAVLADSVALPGGDTLWWLHRRASVCDTIEPYLGCYQNHYPGLPGPLGLWMRRMDAGRWRFGGPADTVRLEAFARTGETWPWTAARDARVDAVFDSLLWGTADSVKRILVGGADTVLLSRRHGLLRWPSAFGVGDTAPFRLAGIAGRDRGRPLPSDWRAWFRPPVGTRLLYEVGTSLGFSEGRSAAGRIWLTVTAVTEEPDRILIDLDGTWQGVYLKRDAAIDTIRYADSRFRTRWTVREDGWDAPVGGGAPDALTMDWSIRQAPAVPAWTFGPPAEEMPLSRVGLGVDGHRVLQDFTDLPDHQPWDWTDRPSLCGPYRNTGTPVVGHTSSPYKEGSFLLEGLGLARWQREGYHEGAHAVLVAWRTDTAAWGDFVEEPFVAGVGQGVRALRVVPNPASTHLRVDGWREPCTAVLYDAGGRVLRRFVFDADAPLDVSALPAGLYRLQLIPGAADAPMGLARFVVQRR